MPKTEVKPEQPVKEELVAEEVVAEEEPVLTIEGEDGKVVSSAELAESLSELKDKVKAAGMRPLQNVITSYASTILGAVDGLLGALEGKKKK